MVASIVKPTQTAPGVAPGASPDVSGVLKRAPERLPGYSPRSGAVAGLRVSTDVDEPAPRVKLPARSRDVSGSKPAYRQSRVTRADSGATPAHKEKLDTATAESGCNYCREMAESFAVEMHVLGRQTENRLLVLQREVAECKSVDEAANFTRWLRASGVLALLERFSNTGPLPVDGNESTCCLKYP